MKFVKCYQDLCREIEIYEERVNSLVFQKGKIQENWLKPISDISGIENTRIKVQENNNNLDFGEEVYQMAYYENQIEKYKELLLKLQKSRKNIENRINEFEGLVLKIVYRREIVCESFENISVSLGYSTQYIRNVYYKYRE